MQIGLFFGSFNPIHIGHLIIANYIIENTDLDELWFVVSPQNPLKSKKSLLHDHDRPSYTIDTLIYLQEKYPKYTFSLIMGEDNLHTLSKWKNNEVLVKNYSIFVYPRISKVEGEVIRHNNIKKINAPVIELSATEIRKMIKENKNIRPMLPPEVFEYIDKMGFYR